MYLSFAILSDRAIHLDPPDSTPAGFRFCRDNQALTMRAHACASLDCPSDASDFDA
jgi:hypothetical protein